MNIEEHNRMLTAKCQVIMTEYVTPAIHINYHHIATIQRYYQINGAPTPDMIQAQVERTKLTCKTILG